MRVESMDIAAEWMGIGRKEDPMVYLDDVFRYAAARLGQREEAEDVAIEVVQALPSPCRKSNLKLYMIGMARRKIADRARRNRKYTSLIESDRPVRFDLVTDEATMVAQTLKALTVEQRDLLTLKYVCGLTSEEIAGAISKKPSAVDSALQRARAAFEKEWSQNMGGEE